MKEILSISIPITISYNNYSIYDENLDSKPAFGLAVRILFRFELIQLIIINSFFFEPDALALLKFSELCPKNTTIAFAIACIQVVYPERGVLLLVDELLKAQGPNQSQSGTVGVILSQIGMCLDTFSSAHFNVLVSSLDPRPFTSLTGYFTPP